MQTQVTQEIEKPAEAILKGEAIVFPTETVYGLGAYAFNEEAVRSVFAIKGRPSDNPLIVHIAHLDQAKELSNLLDERFFLLAKTFWPGPLTIIVAHNGTIPDTVSGGLPTVAIRMPSHPVARALIKKTGPLVAPSANLSGRPSPTSVAHCLQDLDGKVPYIIDGGSCEVGIESTVLSLYHEKPTLLRPGKITREELSSVLGCVIADPVTSEPAYSPGMKYRHYAPNAKVRVVYEKPKEAHVIPTAKNFYHELRKADLEKREEIVLYCDRDVQKDAGLMNRILRSAGQIS